MDAKLAEMYGTNQVDETDAETLATAAFAEKMASAEENADANIDGMSDEEAESLAQSLISDDDETASTEEPSEAASEEAEEEEEEKVASAEEVLKEKIAEADYLGRVMAHAFVQERRKIASAEADKVKAAAKKDDGKVMGHLKQKKANAETEDKVSALDQLAMARAQEILKASGIEPEQEKQSSIDEEKAAQLAAKVDARAFELLKEQGYEIVEQEQK